MGSTGGSWKYEKICSITQKMDDQKHKMRVRHVTFDTEHQHTNCCAFVSLRLQSSLE